MKSDIQNLKAQHHQSQRSMVPWATVDPSIVMAAPFLHPLALQPLPFIPQTQHSATPNPCSTFIPYLTTVNPQPNQPTALNVSSLCRSGPKNSMPMSFDQQATSSNDNVDNSNDLPTDLELKVAGSAILRKKNKRGASNQRSSMRRILWMEVVQAIVRPPKLFEAALPIVWMTYNEQKAIYGAWDPSSKSNPFLRLKHGGGVGFLG